MSKSEIFYYLGTINYMGFKFNIYKNKKHIKYYLKVIDTENNKLQYPMMEEFVQLNKLFYRAKFAMAFGINRNQEGKSIRIDPKVVTDVIKDNFGKIIRVEMVSLAAALLLSGSAFAMEPNVRPHINSEKSVSQENDGIQNEDELIDDSEIWTQGDMQFYFIDPNKNENKYEDNVLVYKFEDSTYICRSTNEFVEKAGLKKDVNLEDLLEAVNNNNNIPEEFKKFISERITNLVTNKHLEGTNWAIFYDNLEKLNFEWQSTKEMQSEMRKQCCSSFYTENAYYSIKRRF